MAAGPAQLRVRQIPLSRLHTAPWNANVATADTMAKVRRSVADFGIVENLVARPLSRPCPMCGTNAEHYEVISGNHRLELYGELGLTKASVHVLEIDDAHARILAETLNRTRGKDDPEAYEKLIREVLAHVEVDTITAYLPETEHSIDKLLNDPLRRDSNFATMTRRGPSKSRRGEIYELGQHRLMCGDATSPEDVAKLLGPDEPILLITDPPYGVSLDMSDSGTRGQRGRKSPGETTIQGDTRVDWAEAWQLVPSLTVAYVWHAGSTVVEVGQGLQRIGFDIVQMIIWDKGRFALGRNHYHWQHETAFYAARVGREVPWYGTSGLPAFYARKRGSQTPWLGGRDQSTVWFAPSPTMTTAENRALQGGADTNVDHPTQKPVEIYVRPIKNHLEQGECFYDSFAGSGTAIIAAELSRRRCLAMELDPHFCDEIRRRYADFVERPDLAP